MSEESYFVFCDDRVNRDASASTTPVNLVFGFATTRPGEYHAWMLSYQAGRARLRPIAVNRLTTSASRVESEIESSILSSQPGAT